MKLKILFILLLVAGLAVAQPAVTRYCGSGGTGSLHGGPQCTTAIDLNTSTTLVAVFLWKTNVAVNCTTDVGASPAISFTGSLTMYGSLGNPEGRICYLSGPASAAQTFSCAACMAVGFSGTLTANESDIGVCFYTAAPCTGYGGSTTNNAAQVLGTGGVPAPITANATGDLIIAAIGEQATNDTLMAVTSGTTTACSSGGPTFTQIDRYAGTTTVFWATATSTNPTYICGSVNNAFLTIAAAAQFKAAAGPASAVANPTVIFVGP